MGTNVNAPISLGTKGKRVAIIGAGPGGIAAGVALTKAGFDVKVFERHPELRPLGGAIILNATGIVILRGLGVQVDDIFAAGLPEFRRHDGRGVAAELGSAGTGRRLIAVPTAKRCLRCSSRAPMGSL